MIPLILASHSLRLNLLMSVNLCLIKNHLSINVPFKNFQTEENLYQLVYPPPPNFSKEFTITSKPTAVVVRGVGGQTQNPLHTGP